jgi:hypothetical protein
MKTEKKKYLENLESSDDEEPICIPKKKKEVVSAVPDQKEIELPKKPVKGHRVELIKDALSIANNEKVVPIQKKPKAKKQVVVESSEEESEEEVAPEPVKPVKAKRQVSEATKENLRKGREALKLYWEQKRAEKQEIAEKYAIKKANSAIKQKLKIKKDMGCEDMSSSDEEPVMIVKKPTKPEKKKKSSKKKQTIIIQQQSDDSSDEEDEVIYKTKTIKQEPKVVAQQPSAPQKRDIVFF